MLCISCHADTGFRAHSLTRPREGILCGHLDNFAGVHAVMTAYFSGRMRQPHTRIELTYGEETNCAGARGVAKTLAREDLVVVVDVTATPTRKDFVIEKCRLPRLAEFLHGVFEGLSYDLYPNCPDPVSDMDETDIYIRRCKNVFFLGVPVWGGDYNAGAVRCRARSLDAIAEALCRLSEAYPKYKPE